MNGEAGEGIRFADVLTTAAAASNYLGDATVTPRHALAALAILRGERTIDDLGRPQSPLARRAPGSGAVDPALQALVRRWFDALGDVNAELDAEQAAALGAELEALGDSRGGAHRLEGA